MSQSDRGLAERGGSEFLFDFDHGEIAGDIFAVLKAATKTAGLGALYRFSVQVTLKIGEHSAPEPESRRVSVLRDPKPDGTWASTTVLDGDATVSPLFAPQISIPLSELF
ncbi:hypothetical protein BH10PSE4_BH10PSE4_15880 [soil metagenome]